MGARPCLSSRPLACTPANGKPAWGAVLVAGRGCRGDGSGGAAAAGGVGSPRRDGAEPGTRGLPAGGPRVVPTGPLPPGAGRTGGERPGPAGAAGGLGPRRAAGEEGEPAGGLTGRSPMEGPGALGGGAGLGSASRWGRGRAGLASLQSRLGRAGTPLPGQTGGLPGPVNGRCVPTGGGDGSEDDEAPSRLGAKGEAEGGGCGQRRARPAAGGVPSAPH